MAKIPLNLTSEGQKYPPEVRVRHETCSTICGTPVQAILDQKNLTGLARGVREGQNMAHVKYTEYQDLTSHANCVIWFTSSPFFVHFPHTVFTV